MNTRTLRRRVAAHVPAGLRPVLHELRDLASHPLTAFRHRRRSRVLAGRGFADYAGGVFNPGALRLPDGDILVVCKGQHRHWLDAQDAHYRDFLRGDPLMLRLDPSLRIRQVSPLAVDGVPLGPGEELEDFRLFQRSGEVWSNFNVISVTRRPGACGYSGSRIGLARIDLDGKALDWRGSPEPDFATAEREKNWAFAEAGQDLLAFYSLSPYRVLRGHGSAVERLSTVVDSPAPAALRDPGGFATMVSFSTNPVPYDADRWLVLVHQVDPGGLGRLFHHWALLVDRASLRPTHLGRWPLLGGIGARGRFRGVVYAMGVVWRDDEALVFHGEGDSLISYSAFTRAELEQSWIALPEPGQCALSGNAA